MTTLKGLEFTSGLFCLLRTTFSFALVELMVRKRLLMNAKAIHSNIDYIAFSCIYTTKKLRPALLKISTRLIEL